MSRSSFGFRRSFTSGRKTSRENRKHEINQHQGSTGREHNELHEKRQRSRHDNSDADKATRSIFGDVPLTDTERRFLWAAQSGNLPALEVLLEEVGTFNLSCRDYLGRTALQLAVLGEHYDCIELLLEKSRLDVIEEGLLHAISSENVKICDMFLSHPVYSDQRARMQMDFQHGFYEQEDSSSSFAPDITPIVLAAQCNNFDVVHMLIQKGFTIPTPHNYFCLCTECYNHKDFDRVVHSKSRLNAYRGLASTAYLCLSCDDPIYAAFELSRSLQKLADREKEHKNEYRKLSDKCKNFAVDLLDQCRTHEEVMSALHGGTDTRDLTRIKMAIRYEQKKFISHASCQEHLASMWYSGASWFQHQNFPIKLVMVPFGIIFIPVTAIIYVFLPYSRVGKVLKSPFMKFMNYICSYTAFLVLLFLGTQLSSFKSSHLFVSTEGAVNSLIIFYVLGMFWAECKQLWEEGVKGYFAQMWNYMDITMLALYTAGYSTEAVIYTKTKGYANTLVHSEDEPILNPQILSKVLFSVANVMSFARIAYILPANETFGQLQISYGRMLQDVGKFIFIYFTVMIAFICGLTSLYSIARNDNFAGILETTGTLFWAAFGMGNSKAPEISNDKIEVSPLDDAMERKSKDGEIMDKEHLAVIEIVGYIMYGVYILGAVVVLINMLIAMMSNTFEEIQKSEDSEWKFARAKLWISFIEQGTTLPIPFNIIPTPKSGLKIVRLLKDCICCQQKQLNYDWQSFKQCDQKYKAIMHRVVLRYIHKMKFEKKGDSLKDELLDTREEVIFQLHSVYGRQAARLELLENDLATLVKYGLGPQESCPSPDRLPLFYTRSVPAHQRAGSYRQCLADQPRVSYLQRRKSCYYERPKPDVFDKAVQSKESREMTHMSSGRCNQLDAKKASCTFQTRHNQECTGMSTAVNSIYVRDYVHSPTEEGRTLSDTNGASLLSPEEYLPKGRSLCRQISPQTCGATGGLSETFAEYDQCEPLTCLPQTATSLIKNKQSATNVHWLQAEVRSKQESDHTFPVDMNKLNPHHFNVPSCADTNINTENTGLAYKDSLRQCANELYTLSQKTIMSAEVSDSRQLSPPDCSSLLHKSESERQLDTGMSAITQARPELEPGRHGRKFGRANNIYIPDVLADFTFDAKTNTESENSHFHSVFFTNQSRDYRYSMSDLQPTDQLTYCFPVHDINSRLIADLIDSNSININSSNRNTQADFNPRISLENRENDHFISSHNDLKGENIAQSCAVSEYEEVLKNKRCMGFESVEGRYDTDIQHNKRPSSGTEHEEPPQGSQFPVYTFYQRKSPMRKRETLSVIPPGNKGHRFQHDARPGAREDEPLASLAERYQQHKSNNPDMSKISDDFPTRFPFIIPSMATNLRPFPIPISSDDRTRKQSQLSQHFCDTEHKVATASGGNITESTNPKYSRLKKTSIVSFVRGRRSNKGKQSDGKHKRSLSLSRWNGGSRTDRMKTLQSQRSKEV